MGDYEESPEVIFVFPKNESATLTAKKAKLAEASEVFKTQFGFPTTNQGGDRGDPLRITITDISYESFDKMMKNICGSKIQIEEADYKELLYAARKYLLSDLTLKIITFLEPFLNGKNLLHHFEYIEKFDVKPMNEIMKNVCLNFSVEIINDLDRMSPAFQKRILKLILQSETLGCSEFDLYDAIVKMWKKQQPDGIYDDTKFRQYMENLVNLIRFPVMSVEELAKCGRTPSLLTIEQLIDLQMWVVDKKYSKTINVFSIKKRVDIRLNTYNIELCQNCRVFSRNCRKCDRKM